jgi:acetylornithine deacetylase/succinyl-diaminopimelate desuccinylase-like protein
MRSPADPSIDAPPGLLDHVAASEPWFRSNLRTLVEHKTITPGATTDTEIRAGAEAACAIFREAGADAHLVECSGTPSVLARFAHPAPRARIVIYNHLDVQPADAANWSQADPFAFEVQEHPEREFLYRGRGSTDDKGPGLCGLRAAAWAKQQNLPIDITLLWETEEEIGSPNFAEIVGREREVLGASDAVIVSDTIWPSDVVPAISTGLRGSLHAIFRLETGGKEVHSGLTGGVARNPVQELCALATAIDHAGFWRQRVAPPGSDEVESFVRAGFDPDYFRRAHDLQKLETDVPLEMMLRLWTRPTFEVHGLVGGYTGSGVKTSVPPAAELKVSFRLVPDQRPLEIGDALASFVRAVAPDVQMEITGHLDPYRGNSEGPIHQAICDALTAATGRAPVSIREGGSIGAVPIMAHELGVPIHFLPLSLPDHGYHAPNEYFDWRQARVGIEAFARVFATLANR